ncbi:CsgG/HfaB family protein [Sphingomonas sp. G-3-2-10]|jgi:curli biogenesis system outer membrane secretion channel CsgG|uniref:CsgG/HfaB family protein n=1 Tax=Sphingomonas sp. G-3-2-10 TaxID=2728838 RepID=UPI00146B8884|nr:CsgG/HfaB family protein [Sphingomonas sp. G-3-2-10]NML05643.1 penicillin-binding protein activator LpoB [Sphingomonas sp. G-3-2-10]
MRKLILAIAAVTAFSVTAAPAVAQVTKGKSSGRKAQERGTREIPRCARPLGTIAMVPPENQWWREMNLGSPEAILKVFVQQSGCFTLVNRGRAMNSRAMERALADQGELQRGSNMGKGQVRAADYLLEPDIVSGNRNSGGMNVGGLVGGLIGGRVGAVVGGINVKKKEANVTLSMVDSRTTEEYVVEGYARKTDIGWGAGGGAGWWGGFGAAGASSYQNTEIGQVIVLAYLDAYIKLVQQLGGLPPGEY